MTQTAPIPTAVTTALEQLVSAAARDEPLPTLAPDQAAALADALERAVLDRAYSEAYLTRLLELWENQPPAAELLDDRHISRVREEGVRAVPAGRLARLAIEPTAVLDLRDAVHGDVLRAYWSDRLREFHPRVDQLRDDLLQKLTDQPEDILTVEGLTYTIPPRADHPRDDRGGGERLPEGHVRILEVYAPGLLDRPGGPGTKPVEGAVAKDESARGSSPDSEPSDVNAGPVRTQDRHR